MRKIIAMLHGFFAGIWGALCRRLWRGDVAPMPALPVEALEHVEQGSDACVVGAVQDAKLRHHIAKELKRANVSFRLCSAGQVLSPFPAKQEVLIVEEGASAEDIKAYKAIRLGARVLLLTFDAGPEIEAELNRRGIDDYLVAPITPYTLGASIRRMFLPQARARPYHPKLQGKLDWLDEAEKVHAAFLKSGLSRRLFATKANLSASKVDALIRIATIAPGLRDYLRGNAVWLTRAFSWLYFATARLPADVLAMLVKELVERQVAGERLTYASAKQRIFELAKAVKVEP
jgi:hypothetical protein